MAKNINNDKSLVIPFAFACLLSTLCLIQICDCLIITSVIAGNKKFKTVSFDHPWIKPLTFEKDLPFSTEFRRTQTMRAPKFDVDINVPIKLPVEEEYAYEEPRKPVVSDFFLETSEHNENNNYNKKNNNYNEKTSNKDYNSKPKNEQHHQQQQPIDESDSSRNYDSKMHQPMTYADSNTNFQYVRLPTTGNNNNQLVTQLQQQQQQQSIIASVHRQQVFGVGANREKISRSDDGNTIHTQTVRNGLSNLQHQRAQSSTTRRQAGSQNNVVQYDDQPMSKSAPKTNTNLVAQDSSNNYDYANNKHNNNYNANYEEPKYPQQEFVPGGFINLQLSGPTGGPKMTHADYDRLNWARQVSHTEHAMPFPILNYQQLQNFYGGLGTFTNGLPETRYHEDSLLEKLMSSVTHFTDKLHIG